MTEDRHVLEVRLDAAERQAKRWRRVALGMVTLLALGGAMAFRHTDAPGPLEGSSLTLTNPQGRAVRLSLRPSGELELRFTGDETDAGPQRDNTGLILVSRTGREVVRLGEPSARRIAP